MIIPAKYCCVPDVPESLAERASVSDCASPLALPVGLPTPDSARRLAHSKTCLRSGGRNAS